MAAVPGDVGAPEAGAAFGVGGLEGRLLWRGGGGNGDGGEGGGGEGAEEGLCVRVAGVLVVGMRV